MKRLSLKTPLVYAFALSVLLSTTLSANEKGEMIYAFRSYTSLRPIPMMLVGEIRSKQKMAETLDKDSPFAGSDTRMDQVTVKVSDHRGIKTGQKLYIIDKNPLHAQYRNGLIVGEITVQSFLHTPFYGWVVIGNGILLRVREGLFVARTLEGENLERAFALKKRGDHYANGGDYEKAISAYTFAIQSDRNLPEAQYALGMLYDKLDRIEGRDVEPLRSVSRFAQAWKNRRNFRYQYDEFNFYLAYMDALHRQYIYKSLRASRDTSPVHILNRIDEAGLEATKIFADHQVLLMQLMRCDYYRSLALYGATGSSKEYDSSMIRAGRRMIQLAKSPIIDAESHRVAALYYAQLLRAGSTSDTRESVALIDELYRSSIYQLNRGSRSIKEASSREDRLKEIMGFHVRGYMSYLPLNQVRDPEILSLEQRFGRER